MAYPTAIGCGCLLGAGGASPLHAAEYSMQPTFSWMTDYDSDRVLSYQEVGGSEQALLNADLRLQRSTDDLQLMLDPHFDVRRYSDSRWGPGNDRSLAASLTWLNDRTQVSLTGSIAEQSTLTTELLETGIIDADGRRTTSLASGEVDYSLTATRSLFTQLNYMGTRYSAGSLLLDLELPGYRYASGSAGERFILSDHFTFSASLFGDTLISAIPQNASHEAGGQVELKYSHSEYTTFDLQVGESRRELGGVPGSGTNVLALIQRNLELGSISLDYTRSLVPYGTGVLAQRQQVTAILNRPLTSYLTSDITLSRIQNNKSTVRLGLDRPYYENAVAGLNWQLGESWSLRSEISWSWSEPILDAVTVHEWRTALTMTWKPLPSSISR